MKKIIYYFKQLFPLTYISEYGILDGNKNEKKLMTIWKMWFGICYNIKTKEVS